MDSETQKWYCLCGYGDGEMIYCDSGDQLCAGSHWYHLDCILPGNKSVPRGKWCCPDCIDRAKNRATHRKKEIRRKSRVIVADERNYVIELGSKSGKGPLTTASLIKVDAAERQSRQLMDNMLMGAKLLGFDPKGRVLPTEKSNKSQLYFPSGLCRFRLSPSDLSKLQSLHRVIVRLLSKGNRLTPWAGVAQSDSRKRGYAFLPAKYGNFGKIALCNAGVHFHAAEKLYHEAKKDEKANWNSCARLTQEDFTDDHVDVLQTLISTLHDIIPIKYRPCISMDKLVALQPNLHDGLDHLPGMDLS